MHPNARTEAAAAAVHGGSGGAGLGWIPQSRTMAFIQPNAAADACTGGGCGIWALRPISAGRPMATVTVTAATAAVGTGCYR